MNTFGLRSISSRSFHISLLFSLLSLVAPQDVKSLCEDPVITAADRLGNNTYRVYRDNYYWELVGIPDEKSKVKGPYPVWYPYMAPVDRLSSVQTVIGGSADGLTWKFRGQKYWLYRQNGQLIEGGKSGYDWDLFPGNGFNAVFNDGQLPKKAKFPTMVAFSGIRVYYYNTADRRFRRIGSANGYEGGKDGEKFPVDLTAAFAFPSTDPEVEFYVYLFQRYRYCYRPNKGEDGCKQWRNNTELFGCSGESHTFHTMKLIFDCNLNLGSNFGPTNNPGPIHTQPEKLPEGNGQPIPDDPDVGAAKEGSNPNPSPEPSRDGGGGGTAFLIAIVIVVVVVVVIVIAIVVLAMKGKSQPNQGVVKKGVPPPKSKAGVPPKSGKAFTPSKA